MFSHFQPAGHHEFSNEIETSRLARLVEFDLGILKFREKHFRQLWHPTSESLFNPLIPGGNKKLTYT